MEECGVVLKEIIFNSFYVGRVWWSWKNWFLTVSTLVEHVLVLTENWLLTVSNLRWKLVVLRKKQIFNSF